MAAKKKSSVRFSLAFIASASLSLLLLTYGIFLGRDDNEPTMRLTFIRVAGLALGAWLCSEFFTKRSLRIVAQEVKGSFAVALAGLGALLCAVSAYTLFVSAFHWLKDF